MMKAILLVEDTEDDIFFLRRALAEAGIKNPLHVVLDGRQAIDYLEGNGKYADRDAHPIPFLVLLDLKLPYVMGLDVLKWIRAHPVYHDLLVVILTSSQLEKDMEAANRLGGNGYLIKPPSAEEFLNIARKLEDRWLH